MTNGKDIKDITTMNSEDLGLINEKLSEICQIGSQIAENKEKGEVAISKANEVKTGFFKSKTKALDELKEVSIMNADANIQTLNIVNKLSENQTRMADACTALVAIGAVNIAQNRAIIDSIETKMREGKDKELSEETKTRLIEVIRELKRKQDLLERMERQGAKINELNQRVKTLEEELENSKTKEIEFSRKQKQLALVISITIGIGLAAVILGIVNLLF